MLSVYLNQTVIWKSKQSVNEYNEATYTSASIPARFEYKRKLVMDKQGVQIVSEAVCYTKSLVKPEDVITYDAKDWVVISVKDSVDLEGNVLCYEVSL